MNYSHLHTLKLPQNATPKQISESFQKLSQEALLDEDHEQYKKLVTAYEALIQEQGNAADDRSKYIKAILIGIVLALLMGLAFIAGRIFDDRKQSNVKVPTAELSSSDENNNDEFYLLDLRVESDTQNIKDFDMGLEQYNLVSPLDQSKLIIPTETRNSLISSFSVRVSRYPTPAIQAEVSDCYLGENVKNKIECVYKDAVAEYLLYDPNIQFQSFYFSPQSVNSRAIRLFYVPNGISAKDAKENIMKIRSEASQIITEIKLSNAVKIAENKPTINKGMNEPALPVPSINDEPKNVDDAIKSAEKAAAPALE